MSTIIALSASLLLAAPAALAQSTGTGSCTDVHIFLAKGWNEQYNDQRQTKLVDAICSDLGSNVSCDYEDIILNDLAGSDYCTAVTEGTGNGKQQITAYAAKCPNSKLVLSGYSEGADVVGDIMAGGGGTYNGHCATTSPLDASSDAVCQLAAVMVFGNPRHVPNTSYNVDSGVAGLGQYPRTPEQAAILASYADKLHDWCNINDPTCANGLGTNQAEPWHTNYFDLVTGEAASWAVSKIHAAKSCAKMTSSSSSSSMMASTSTKAAMTTSSSAAMMSSSSAMMASSSSAMMPSSSSAMMSGPAGYGMPSSMMASSSMMSAPAGYGMSSSMMASSIMASASMTKPASYPTTAAAPSSVTTMISGKPACVSYAMTSSMTTWGPYPAYPVSSSYPVTTSWIGWGNGTAATMTMMGSASGTGAAKATGSGMQPGSSYTGAASGVKAAGGLAVAAVVGVVALMA